jgi:multiple sugar transport system substrate-binding protein
MKKITLILTCIFVLTFVFSSTFTFASTKKEKSEYKMLVEPTAGNPFDHPSKANIKWDRFKGTTLDLMMCEHWYPDSIKPFLPDFENLTGIKITMEQVAEESFYKKCRLAMAAGESVPDMFMVGNLDISQYATAGWLEPLDAYINDSSLTDKAWYDYADIMDTVKKAGAFNGKMHIIGIPTAEVEILFYRTDIFKEKGLKVPVTYDEFYKVAKQLTTANFSGFHTRGERGISNWWEWTGIFLSYGGRFFDENMNPIFNSPEGVAATDMWGKLMREFGPKGVETFTWQLNVGYFKAGNSAMMIEASGVTPIVVDPKDSKVVGKVGYASIPRIPGKDPKPNYWTWAMGINAKSKNKKAAWLLGEYLSSKFISYESAQHGSGASRKSVLETPALIKAYGKDWVDTVITALSQHVEPKLIPYGNPQVFAIADEISIGLSNVLTNVETPKAALDNAAVRVKKLLEK